MKKILIMAIMSTLAMVNVQAASNVETCKAFIKEAKSYQSTMNANNVSQATLAFYKDSVVSHCGNIAAKMSFEKNYFVTELMKSENKNVYNCKTSIKMAQAYAETANKSFLITEAHKVNVSDNCGTLVAKKAPAFCLFDVVDSSKDDLKARCIASIEKAHASSNPQAHKDTVIANCGSLQARI